MLDRIKEAENPKIQISNLVKSYNEVRAVNGISLNVAKGSIVGLLGPNGAGKTTTLRMLAGILTPTSGSISICGYDVTQDAVEVKRRIGFLSGDTKLYERLSVREILRFFGTLHQLERGFLEDRIEKLVIDFDMQSYSDQGIGTLSSGQAQRANIARTILHDPEVLILDEATVSLDIISSQFIIDSLRRLKEAGKAILFSTHIMSEAEFLCDEIALIYRGKIIDRGIPSELVSRTNSENLTAAFLERISQEKPSSNSQESSL